MCERGSEKTVERDKVKNDEEKNTKNVGRRRKKTFFTFSSAGSMSFLRNESTQSLKQRSTSELYMRRLVGFVFVFLGVGVSVSEEERRSKKRSKRLKKKKRVAIFPFFLSLSLFLFLPFLDSKSEF